MVFLFILIPAKIHGALVRKKLLAAVVVAFFCLSSSAFAGSLNLFGYGARSSAMGNATVALPVDGFSQNYNPALMSLEPEATFSFGLQGAITSFPSVNNVVIDTPTLGASSFTTGNVNTSTPDTFLAGFAYQTPLSRKIKNPLHLGFYLVTPVERLVGVNTEDSYQPEYALYLSDTQKFVTGGNLSLKISDFLSLGIGGELYFGQGATGSIRQPAQGNSTARLAVDEKPLVAPIAGAVFQVNPQWTIGASFHGAEDYTSNISLQDSISLVGQTPLNFTATSSLFYEPATYRLGVGFSDEKTTLGAGADYQRWVGFNGTVLALQYSTFTGTFSQVLPPTPYHDVIVLHGGAEHKFDKNALRLGYTFMPSPVPDQSGDSNILDSDRHVASLGYGHTFLPDFIDGKLDVDTSAYVQILQNKQVVKNSSQSIGYPGYTIGGAVYGYSLTVTTTF